MQEEQNKFKDGDKVTCYINGVFIEDGVISIEKDRSSSDYGRPFICQNYKDGNDATDKKGYKYSWVLREDFTQTDVTDLKLKEEKKVIDYSDSVENAMDYKIGYKVLVKKGSSQDSNLFDGNEGIIVSTKYSPWSDSYYKQKNTDYCYTVKLYDGREICLWGNDFIVIGSVDVSTTIPGSLMIDDTAYREYSSLQLVPFYDVATYASVQQLCGYSGEVLPKKKKRVNFFVDSLT